MPVVVGMRSTQQTDGVDKRPAPTARGAHWGWPDDGPQMRFPLGLCHCMNGFVGDSCEGLSVIPVQGVDRTKEGTRPSVLMLQPASQARHHTLELRELHIFWFACGDGRVYRSSAPETHSHHIISLIGLGGILKMSYHPSMSPSTLGEASQGSWEGCPFTPILVPPLAHSPAVGVETNRVLNGEAAKGEMKLLRGRWKVKASGTELLIVMVRALGVQGVQVNSPRRVFKSKSSKSLQSASIVYALQRQMQALHVVLSYH